MHQRVVSRTSKSVESLSGVALGALVFMCLVAAWLYVACPYLNNDDIVYATDLFDALNAMPFWHRMANLLFNLDVGQSELRTYGLARIIQYAEVSAFGRSPLMLYVTIVSMHAASAAALFWALRTIARDGLLRTFVAIIWFACPFVLTISHTLHHHLYTMGPLYFLILWIGITLNKPAWPWPVGASILTAGWLMGESNIPAIYFVVGCTAVGFAMRQDYSRVRSVALQGAVSFLLLCAYVVYQVKFVAIAANRFKGVLVSSPDEFWFRMGNVWRGLDYGFWFGLGFQTKDALMGRWEIQPLHVSAIVVSVTLTVAVLAVAILLSAPRPQYPRPPRWIAVSVVSAVAGSLALYVVAHVTLGLTPMTYHYIPPIFALACIAIPLLCRGQIARIVAGILAALCLAFTISSLQAMRSEVYEPHIVKRDRLLAAVRSGKDILLLPHPIKELKPSDSIWPALATVHDYPASDPFTATWVTNLYARFILGFKFVGTEFVEKDGKIIVSYGPTSLAVDDPDRILVVVADPGPYRPKPHLNWYDWKEFAGRSISQPSAAQVP